MVNFPPLADLQFSEPIVNPDGRASDYFLRYLRDRGGFFSEAEQAIADILARQIIAGAGLTGGGDLSANVTLNVGAGTGITVNADDVAIDTTAEAERIRDTMATALVAGANITITVSDPGDTITIAASGGGGGGGGSSVGWQSAGVKRVWMGAGPAGGVQVLGWPTTSTTGGDVAPSIATTNRLTRMLRAARNSVSANTEFGWRWDGGALNFRADAGYVYEGVFGYEVGTTIGQKRLLVGMRAVDAFPGGTVDPSTLANIAGMGADTGDANWQIMYNDGSGTATKVDTGWAKTVGEVFYVRVTGSSSDIKIYAERYATSNLSMTPTATFAEATYNSNIPANTTEIAPIMWGANGATAENGTLAGVYQSILSPF